MDGWSTAKALPSSKPRISSTVLSAFATIVGWRRTRIPSREVIERDREKLKRSRATKVTKKGGEEN